MSQQFKHWCEVHKELIFSNKNGSVTILNFPYELENELNEIPFSTNILDFAERGVIIPSEHLPISLSASNTKLSQLERSEIRAALYNGESIKNLAEYYHVHPRTITRIRNGD